MAGPSFEELFRGEYPRLVAFGIAMVGNVEVARDLAQEKMSRAHASWSSVAGADVPAAWLTRVMKNLLIDHLRRRQVESRAVERLASRPDPAVSPDASAGAQFAGIIATLPERQRVIVALTYGADLSVAQVAAALDIAPGTVKASLWKARRTLSRQLANTHDSEEQDHG